MATLEPKTSFRFTATLNLPNLANSSATRARCLTHAVQAAIGAIDESTLRPVAAREAGLGLQPKALLALLSYCYTREIYGSADVENLLWRDLNYRQLCQGKFPDAEVIQRFRRENPEAIQSCLTATLRFLAELKVKEGFVTKVNMPQLAEEAKRRVIRAMFIDSMQMDGE